MDGCQNYDPFLGTLNIRCRIRIGIQKGTIVLTTTHMRFEGVGLGCRLCGFRVWFGILSLGLGVGCGAWEFWP